MPSSISVDDRVLQLNGAGMRVLALPMVTLNMYEMGLYVPKQTHDMTGLLNNDISMGLKIRIISRFINSKRMTIAAMEGFEKSTDGHVEPLEKDIDRLLKVFSSDIEQGDIYDLVYVPDSGTRIYKNGELTDNVPGFEFKKALFGIWIGDESIQEKLKHGLAGKPKD